MKFKKYLEQSEKRMNIFTKVIIWTFLILMLVYFVNKFFDTYRFRSPIEKRVTVPQIKEKPLKKASIVKEVETMTVDQTIADYIKSKDWDYGTAIRIAKSENFWNYNKHFDCKRTGGLNYNGTRDHGLWQINDIHIESGAITLEDVNDCFKATDFAYRLYKGHNNSFNSWSAYNNGSYLAHNEVIY